MKPGVDQILGMAAGQLMTQIAPLLPASYAQSGAGLLAIMLGLCAQEYDRAADIRVAENADLRRLFADVAPLVADAGLKTALVAASKTVDASLRIIDLDAANYELRRLLIALQIHLEANDARGSLAKVWTVLKAGAARRVLALPGT